MSAINLSTKAEKEHRKQAVIVEGEIELAERAEKILTATSAMAICLATMLGKKKSYGRALVKTLPDELYTKALELAPALIQLNPKIIPPDIMKNFAPERLWPMALEPAFYLLNGYDEVGCFQGTDIKIYERSEDFPEKLRPHRMAFAHLTESILSDFLSKGAEMITKHMGYRHKIDPVWLPEVLRVAAQRDPNYMDHPLNTWFTPSLAIALDFVYPRTRWEEVPTLSQPKQTLSEDFANSGDLSGGWYEEMGLIDTARKTFEAAKAVAFCISFMPKRGTSCYPTLAKAISPEIYNMAHGLAPSLLEHWPKSAFSNDILQNPSPERVWPMFVHVAFCHSQGVTKDLIIPGSTDTDIFDLSRDIPPEQHKIRHEFAKNAVNSLTGFINTGTQLLQEHLGYKYKLDPFWLKPAIDVGLKKEALTRASTEWILPCVLDAWNNIYLDHALKDGVVLRPN